MKTYVFTYFVNNSDGKCVSRDYLVRSSRFSQAFGFFARFFNSIETSGDLRDYSVTYSVVSNGVSSCRSLPGKYLSCLHRFVSEV